MMIFTAGPKKKKKLVYVPGLAVCVCDYSMFVIAPTMQELFIEGGKGFFKMVHVEPLRKGSRPILMCQLFDI